MKGRRTENCPYRAKISLGFTTRSRLDALTKNHVLRYSARLVFHVAKSEYLGPGMCGANPNTFMHSIRMMGLGAYQDSKRAQWGIPCDSVTLQIHGSKTDWLNRGTVRAHGNLPSDHPNLEICLVRNLMALCHIFPRRFCENTNQPFARLGNDALISDRKITLVIKRASASNGLNTDPYSPHSLRAGGGLLCSEPQGI